MSTPATYSWSARTGRGWRKENIESSFRYLRGGLFVTTNDDEGKDTERHIYEEGKGFISVCIFIKQNRLPSMYSEFPTVQDPQANTTCLVVESGGET